MLDRQWMNRELNEARLARQDAEAAQEDVEDMLRELQGLRFGLQPARVLDRGIRAGRRGGTPQRVVDRLNKAINEALNDLIPRQLCQAGDLYRLAVHPPNSITLRRRFGFTVAAQFD